MNFSRFTCDKMGRRRTGRTKEVTGVSSPIVIVLCVAIFARLFSLPPVHKNETKIFKIHTHKIVRKRDLFIYFRRRYTRGNNTHWIYPVFWSIWQCTIDSRSNEKIKIIQHKIRSAANTVDSTKTIWVFRKQCYSTNKLYAFDDVIFSQMGMLHFIRFTYG